MADRDDERLRVRHSGLIGIGGLLLMTAREERELKVRDVAETRRCSTTNAS